MDLCLHSLDIWYACLELFVLFLQYVMDLLFLFNRLCLSDDSLLYTRLDKLHEVLHAADAYKHLLKVNIPRLM